MRYGQRYHEILNPSGSYTFSSVLQEAHAGMKPPSIHGLDRKEVVGDRGR